MAKQKQRKSRMSSGNGKKIRIEREAKRQAKFAAKRETGKAYNYSPISAEKGSKKYNTERYNRSQKNVDRRDPVSKMRSVMRKLENALAKELEMKKASAKN